MHCAEVLGAAGAPRSADDVRPWYFRTAFILLAVASAGPLALPLISWRPNTSRGWKVGLTLGILMMSWLMFQVAMDALRIIKRCIDLLRSL